MLSRRLAFALLALAPTAACTDDSTPAPRDNARLVSAAGPHVVVAASTDTQEPSLGCGGGPALITGPAVLFVSDDAAASFERIVPEDARPLAQLGVKDGVFYAIRQGADLTSFSVATSADGRTWTDLVTRTGVANQLALTADGIAVAYNTGILSSADGVTWADRPVPDGLYLPTATLVGNALMFATPADNVLRTWNGTAWDRRSINQLSGITSIIPAAGGLLVSGVDSFARVDLASSATPSYGSGGFVQPIVTSAGVLDAQGMFAPIEGTAIGAPARVTDPFVAAAADGTSVAVLRGDDLMLSTDGGATFGAPVHLPTLAAE